MVASVVYDEAREPVVEAEPTLREILDAVREIRVELCLHRKRLQTLQDEFEVFKTTLHDSLEELKLIADLAYDAANTARAIATRLEGASGGHPREYGNGEDRGKTDPGIGT